jgi:hypothetical protein
MGKLLVGLRVVWVVGLLGLDLGLGLELGIGVGYRRFLVGGGGVVDRNGLGLPNRVQGEFGHIHLEIDLIDSIVRSHEASGLVGPDISSILVKSRREGSDQVEKTYRIRSHPPPISHGWSNITTSSSLLLLANNRKRFPRSIRRR